jgi:UDP-2,3-diacylglucosamine pyrophosphatase LpxH
LPFDRFPVASAGHRRALFLSDLHLGALGSRPDLILRYLRAHPADSYYLVGDVLDLWLPFLPHWSDQDQAVIDHLRQRQAEGAALHYIRGNHDPQPECAPEHARLDVEPVETLVHRGGDGRRYLVIHGDQADSRLVRWHWTTRLGSLIDHVLRRLDQRLRWLSGRTDGEARSMVEAMLNSVNALSYAGRRHERRMVAMAHAQGLDGVICGHFHIAGLHEDHGVLYANCGDWVDSFTALEERADGSLRLFGGRAALVDTVVATDPVDA